MTEDAVIQNERLEDEQGRTPYEIKLDLAVKSALNLVKAVEHALKIEKAHMADILQDHKFAKTHGKRDLVEVEDTAEYAACQCSIEIYEEALRPYKQ